MSKGNHLMTGEDLAIWLRLDKRMRLRTAHQCDIAVIMSWCVDRDTGYTAVESAERDIAFYEMQA